MVRRGEAAFRVCADGVVDEVASKSVCDGRS